MIGVVSMGVIVFGWTRLDLVDGVLYRGGFLGFALLAAAVIVSVLVGVGPLPAVLATKPFAAIGLISYGIYLFHWPIFLWLDEARTGLSRGPLFALRVAVTFGVATASYFLLEMPFRRRAFRLGPKRTWALGAATVALILAGVSVASSRDVDTNLAGIDEAAGAAPVIPPDRPGARRPRHRRQ